ncbi:MAG: hypothetical protein ACRDOB_04295, partial [Streptosporangiaceae bacterium]
MGTYAGRRARRAAGRSRPGQPALEPEPVGLAAAADGAIDARRRLAGVLIAAGGLPPITVVLAAFRPHLNLADDLLVYLVAVVTITVVGGFWP